MSGSGKAIFVVSWLLLLSCSGDDPAPGGFSLTAAFVGTKELASGSTTNDVATDQSIALNFSKAIDRSTSGAVTLSEGSSAVAVDITYSSQDKTLILFPKAVLHANSGYSINIGNDLKAADGAVFDGLVLQFKTVGADLTVSSFTIAGVDAMLPSTLIDEVPLTPTITIAFSAEVDAATANADNIVVSQDGTKIAVSTSVAGKEVSIVPATGLAPLRRFQVQVSNNVTGARGEHFSGVQRQFYTKESGTPLLPMLPHDEDSDADNTNDLLSVVQQQTFKYFWDFAHPVSGMARERNTSGDVVTSGGSGFGIMSLIVGMERKFISRADGIARMDKMVTFLENADRFHGAWSHWINGATGEAVPFSAKDNGGDLVETSFLVQGLIAFRQYLSAGVPAEAALRNRITSLWESVEWDWYRKQNEQVLYWHWSPDYNWDMNFPLYGYFEEQITYVLAASSPTHGVPLSVYSNGYGSNGAIVKDQTHYGIQLPLGAPSPLFWVHYSYLGLDPHFSDAYANYWSQNVSATRINLAYCTDNPKNYVGYSDRCWGLTSSDDPNGYDAHSPANDNGVITPTAALSSFPYTPEESMKALKFFYYSMGDRLWGEYGFYDAFNLTQQWTASSYLAIDQGPIIVMIENYRTGLLWDLFMSAPEVQQGFSNLNFVK